MCRIPGCPEPTGTKSPLHRSQSVHSSVETGPCWFCNKGRRSEGTQEGGCGMNGRPEFKPTRVDELLESGYTHIVDADLKSYFDTIPHDRLMALIENKINKHKYQPTL